jgi:RNA polymerase sigma factor (TIGR02999 family)
MDDAPSREITEVLAQVGRGDASAAAGLLPLIYAELHALAGSYFRRENPAHTLQPTALVHEAFLKLTTPTHPSWESRSHFFAVAARAMRQILANHVQGRKTAKRGGGRQRVTLSGLATPSDVESQIDLIDLSNALDKLAELSPRQAHVVEMRFFAGLGEEEIALVLDTSVRTVRRDWRMARAYLLSELSGQPM